VKKTTLIWVLSALFFSSISSAAETFKFIDENKDGREEAKMFYENGRKTRAEVDMDGDGVVERFVKFKNDKRFTAESDTNKDGAIDQWEFYNSRGIIVRSAKDTNRDGIPDQFKAFLKGRTLILKESDRNFDGKIDKRQLTEWGMISYGPHTPKVPGYVMVWKEEDSDFDGLVDVYRVKGKRDAGKDKIGKPIDVAPSKGRKEEEEEKKPKGEKVLKDWWGDRIKALNERFGHKDQ